MFFNNFMFFYFMLVSFFILGSLGVWAMGVLVSIESLGVALLLMISYYAWGSFYLFIFLFVVLGAILGLLFFIINVKDFGHDQVSGFLS